MCGCGNSTRSGQPATWKVKMLDGTIKVYSSDVAAKMKHEANEGSILIPPAGVSV